VLFILINIRISVCSLILYLKKFTALGFRLYPPSPRLRRARALSVEREAISFFPVSGKEPQRESFHKITNRENISSIPGVEKRKIRS